MRTILLITTLALELIFLTPSHAFELISHKGIHQTRATHISYLRHQRCPTKAYLWEGHQYLENTLPAIKEAFRRGANAVEIDLMGSRDNQVVLFHDSNLECLTGVRKLVEELTLAELRRVDLSGGYSYQNRTNNPLKGLGVGKVVTLQEVFEAYPGHQWIINPKQDNDKFLEAVGDILNRYEREGKISQSQIRMWGSDKAYKYLKIRFPRIGERLSHMDRSLSCLASYQAYGWMGVIQSICKDISVVIALENLNLWNLWGGVLGFIHQLHLRGIKVYLMNANDSKKWGNYWSLGFDGIIASRISDVEG